MNTSPKIPDHHLFHHEAMMTTFYLRLCGEDPSLLASLACECIHLIDELERKLSRYHVGGDVAQINAMNAGETLHISEECHECLLVAMEACVLTGGLFDPTLGAMIEHRKTGATGELPPACGQLIVSPDSPMIFCESPGKIIDLGGIGKGFALDQIAQFLQGWDIEGALLSSGASTHLAMGPQAWPMDLAENGKGQDREELVVVLQNEALSASGTEIQGNHIVHPQEWTGEASKTKRPSQVWACSDSAAIADAWSTALMLMTSDEAKTVSFQSETLNHVYCFS